MEIYLGGKNRAEKIQSTIDFLKHRIPEIKDEDMLLVLGRIKKKNSGVRKTELSEIENKVYDLLLSQNLNPQTVYEWFRAYMVPEEIWERYKNGKLNLKQLHAINKNEIERRNARRNLEVIKLGRKLINEFADLMAGWEQ
ncbi:MAG: hypothetical protein KAT77_00835 [Nanoarchaeota archaeon]|nr:hypothetical protein [Nanoarchaeota archaeon]